MSRTGTTSIQSMLYQNKKTILKNHNMLYPTTGLVRNAHHLLSDCLGFIDRKKKVDKNIITKLQQSFYEEFKLSNAQTAIISSEYFCNDGCVDLVQTCFKDFDVRIIIFLRRHEQWLESTYRQFSKFNNYYFISEGFDSFYKHISQYDNVTNYKKLISKWTKVFGKEAVNIELYNEDINLGLKEFLGLLGIKDCNKLKTREVLNTSPSRLSCYLIEFAKRYNYFEHSQDKVILAIIDEYKSPNDMSFISPLKTKEIYNIYINQYKQLVDNYQVSDLILKPLIIGNYKQWQPFHLPSRKDSELHINSVLEKISS